MKKQKRKPTMAAGAVIERDLVQRYLTRQMKKILRSCLGHPTPYSGQDVELRVLRRVSGWIKHQPERTRKPGGIGR